MDKKKYAFHTVVVGVGIVAASTVFYGCAKSNNTSDGTGSDVATSVVSGSLNGAGNTNVGFNDIPSFKSSESKFAQLLEEINPIKHAYAAMWSCSGGTLSPTFAGMGNYTYTPVSCTVTWANGRSASSSWSGTGFALNYSAGCDTMHAWPANQTGANCTVTRTT